MGTSPIGGAVSGDDLEIVESLARAWIDNRANTEWMQEYLADEFRFSTFLLPKILDKRSFIDIVSQVPAKIRILSIAAEGCGAIILVRWALDVLEEEFTVDLGPGMPTKAEITGQVSGQKLAYNSAFRRYDGGWKCFDHHQIGPIT